MLDGDFFLVTGGDGRGVIVEKVLDLCTDYLPSPLDRDQGQTVGIDPKTGNEVIRKADDKEPLTALAFKVATDPFVGKLIFIRVYAGKMTSGSMIYNATTGDKELSLIHI